MEIKNSKDSKKSKKSKSYKKGKESTSIKLAAAQRKEKEVGRILQLKQEILVKSEMSYLEYLEIRSELERLNMLKDNFTRRVEKLKQQAK
ncbi:uncharacterized protein LOC115631809 [Scaptodrosophila lebanonensis]|uniref:Uncharacterized protein LOC115631809 n=1 Tax=Drosophila lebanonensis TaxID=7225 RepID=A0A6J2U7K9_DROLE|nr:uncharacterized protein LOC115631809 [Scaptodrosophila lebanonensis]